MKLNVTEKHGRKVDKCHGSVSIGIEFPVCSKRNNSSLKRLTRKLRRIFENDASHLYSWTMQQQNLILG